MARVSLLTAGFLLSLAATLPVHAAVTEDQTIAPSPVATRAPIPLQEPHAVDQTPLPPIEQAVPAKPAKPSPRHGQPAAKTRAKLAPAQPQAMAKSQAEPKTKVQAAQHQAPPTVRPKARPAPPQVAAKSGPARPRLASKPPAPRAPAQPPKHHPRMLALAPHRAWPMARRNFDYRRPEERPHSGSLYEIPPEGAMPPMPGTPPPAFANGCDEACQYRDWLNRYAAWYRDFGRYYYGAPSRPAAPRRPMPPPVAYSENRPAPAAPSPAYRPDQSERDRLDPWHGYNPYSPANGY